MVFCDALFNSIFGSFIGKVYEGELMGVKIIAITPIYRVPVPNRLAEREIPKIWRKGGRVPMFSQVGNILAQL